MTNKIDREDMLALTRRMNVARSSFTRIAGCYVDKDGDFDGSFNVNFLKLSAAEKKKNIELAKVVPFAAKCFFYFTIPMRYTQLKVKISPFKTLF